jgi:NAD(P)-dependent dehydrogenase (short-subunit alcohol dehydrogenase family)
MARIFITGSSTGLGLMAGQLLIAQGHQVVLHGRNRARADAAMVDAPGAEAVVVGDLARITEMKAVADQVNTLGRFDAVIHNAGVGYREPRRIETEDGLPHIFAINVLAPYVLTALIARPDRLVYLSSGMHHGVEPNLDDLLWTRRRWQGAEAYAESKLHDVILAFAIARRWRDVRANALEPGWVPTRMGGPGAPGDMSKAHLTQAWLAVSDDTLARSSGEYFYHQALRDANPAARDEAVQDQLLAACGSLSGVALPDASGAPG